MKRQHITAFLVSVVLAFIALYGLVSIHALRAEVGDSQYRAERLEDRIEELNSEVEELKRDVE